MGAIAQTGSADIRLGRHLGQSPVPGKLEPRPMSILGATSAPVSGPFLGYAWYPSRSAVKAVLGIPGAAYLGKTLDLGGPFRTLAVSSARKYALAVLRGTGKGVVVALGGPARNPISIEIPRVRENADRVVLSPRGVAAGLYHRQSRVVELVKFLPHDPQPAGEVMLAGLPLITAMAVSDDARGVLVAVSEGSAGKIYSLQLGSPPRFLMTVKRPVSVSFAPLTGDALVADYDGNSVFLIEDAFGRSEVKLVAGSHQGVSRPRAAEFLHDGSRFLVADSGNNRILVLDRSGEIVDVLSSRRTPVMLRRLDEQDTFQFSAPEDGAVGLVRTRQTGNEIFFAAASGDSPATPLPGGPLPSRRRSASASSARGR